MLKSLRKKRLVYESFGNNFDYYLTYFIGAFFIVLASVWLGSTIKVLPFWCIMIGITFIAWMISNIFFLNVLTEVKGESEAYNRKEIIEILNNYFNRNIEDEGQLVIRDVKYSGFIYFGRIITVLLKKDSVYINIQSLGRADAVSVFHGFSDYLKARRIARQFLSHLLQKSEV